MSIRTGCSTTIGVFLAIALILTALAVLPWIFGLGLVWFDPQFQGAMHRAREKRKNEEKMDRLPHALPVAREPDRPNAEPKEIEPAEEDRPDEVRPGPYDPQIRFQYWSGLRRRHADDMKLSKDPDRMQNLDPFQKRDLEQRLRDWDGKLKREFDKELKEHPDLEPLLKEDIQKAKRKGEKVA